MNRLNAGAALASLVLAGAVAPSAGAKHHPRSFLKAARAAHELRASLRPVGAPPTASAGIARLVDNKRDDQLGIRVRGLQPGQTYSWHIHQAPAGVTDPCAAPAADAASLPGWIYRPLTADKHGNAGARGRSFTFSIDPAATYYVDVHSTSGVLLCGRLNGKQRQKPPGGGQGGTGEQPPVVVDGGGQTPGQTAPPPPPPPPAPVAKPVSALRAWLAPVGASPSAQRRTTFGEAHLHDGRDDDRLQIRVRGLQAGQSYSWHLHQAPAGGADPCAAPAADAAPLAGWIYRPLTARANGSAEAEGRSFTFAIDPTATYYVDVHEADGQVALCGVLRAGMHP